jgi:hypothetical protein
MSGTDWQCQAENPSKPLISGAFFLPSSGGIWHVQASVSGFCAWYRDWYHGLRSRWGCSIPFIDDLKNHGIDFEKI